MKHKGDVETETCSLCNGTGYVAKHNNVVGIEYNSAEQCPACDGYGFVISKEV